MNSSWAAPQTPSGHRLPVQQLGSLQAINTHLRFPECMKQVKTPSVLKSSLKLELTYDTTRMHCHHPVMPPGCNRMVPSAALQRMAYGARLTMHCQLGMTQKLSSFCPWWPWPLTLTFKLIWARGQTCLPCEFGTNPFSSSRYVWGINKQTKKQTN